MAYNKHTWSSGSQPTAAQFNEIETGIYNAVDKTETGAQTVAGTLTVANPALATSATRNITVTGTDNIEPFSTLLPTGEIILVYD